MADPTDELRPKGCGFIYKKAAAPIAPPYILPHERTAMDQIKSLFSTDPQKSKRIVPDSACTRNWQVHIELNNEIYIAVRDTIGKEIHKVSYSIYGSTQTSAMREAQNTAGP